ncbi:MAG TPA: TIGR04255 family protein [Thermoguttaceae bacterium]|nr:TIGR04255 family protein [Thermoguttaceae bacterium]HPP52471.1 TIGR04255 family protein [Thermoguttaceae bacterium]
MGRKYANPPILEAVCEFRLSRKTPWDITVPGLLYEKLQQEFPLREDRVVEEWKIASLRGRKRRKSPREQRAVFFTEEKNVMVALGRRLLAVHVLRSYPGWSVFKPKIAKAWECLTEITEIQGLDTIALSYINKIDLPSAEATLKGYLNFYPFVGDRLPQDIANFMVAVESIYAEGRDRGIIALNSAVNNPRSFFLQIDYFLAQADSIPPTIALRWVEEAHSRVEEIFEGCITEELRKQFGP